MNLDTLGFALAAGMVATVNPCGFAMLPAYLTLVVAGDGTEDGAADAGRQARTAAIGRALAATATMAVGFLVVFGAFGLVVAPLASSVQQYLPAVTVVIGLALVALGGWMLAGKEITLLLPKPGKGAPTARLGSMLGYGFAYAIASLSCTIGPFLAVTASTFRTGSVTEGVTAYLAYGLGMTLVVGVLAVAVALARSAVATGARRILPYVNRIGGGLLVLAGLYVGYYGVHELRLFHGGGSAEDPIVDAAGEIQSVLASWVDTIGAIPLLLALAALVTLGITLGRTRRKSRR
ncbi:cytochrome c biogenesis CcdA family protein [Amycolatopsis aidingensis]|uniref:cytochrome c biogenesis CcdA family protein n=1 Tax=Amycolatopsis aidingensis TaxID=2842453 RepID=UPI001C0AC63B|nr:cytochrome c biogenesis protein CcdA [Amycolatopsis aidingensis]